MDFISDWTNHSCGIGERENLDETDKVWEELSLTDLEPACNVKKGTLLFRVHTKVGKKPEQSDYDDMVNAEEVFRVRLKFWESLLTEDGIRWDNHWVSFTDSPNTIGSNYFQYNNLRGFVIVISSKKAVNISNQTANPTKKIEREHVAPLDKSTCVEVLPFEDFMQKYGTGNSDYEKSQKHS